MTGHFTTADGCEKWMTLPHGTYATEYFRLPTSYLSGIPGESKCGHRVYRVESIEHSRGLAHYIEVEHE